MSKLINMFSSTHSTLQHVVLFSRYALQGSMLMSDYAAKWNKLKLACNCFDLLMGNFLFELRPIMNRSCNHYYYYGLWRNIIRRIIGRLILIIPLKEYLFYIKRNMMHEKTHWNLNTHKRKGSCICAKIKNYELSKEIFV